MVRSGLDILDSVNELEAEMTGQKVNETQQAHLSLQSVISKLAKKEIEYNRLIEALQGKPLKRGFIEKLEEKSKKIKRSESPPKNIPTFETIANLSHRRTLQGHHESVNCLSSFQASGINYLITASEDKIKIWDLSKPYNENICTLSSSTYITSIITLERKFLASAGLDNNVIEIWNLENRKLERTLTGHSDFVYALSTYEMNSKLFLVSGSWDNSIKIWDMSFNCIHTLQGHFGYVISLNMYEKDGKTCMVSGSFDCTIKLWDLHNKSLITTLAEDSCIRNVIVFYKQKKPYLASGSEDKMIKIWNLSNHQLEATLTGYSVYIYSLTSFQTYLAIGNHDRTIEIWDLENYKLLKVLKVPTPTRSLIPFYCNGVSYLISGHENGKIMLWSE